MLQRYLALGGLIGTSHLTAGLSSFLSPSYRSLSLFFLAALGLPCSGWASLVVANGLSSPTRDSTHVPGILNRWTTWEVPLQVFEVTLAYRGCRRKRGPVQKFCNHGVQMLETPADMLWEENSLSRGGEDVLRQRDSASRQGRSKSGQRPLCWERIQRSSGE